MAGETLVLNAGETYLPGMEIARYYWNFGDETVATGLEVSKIYSLPGKYNIQLIVSSEPGPGGVVREVCVCKDIEVIRKWKLNIFENENEEKPVYIHCHSFLHLLLSSACNWSTAQEVPGPDENIPFLITFGRRQARHHGVMMTSRRHFSLQFRKTTRILSISGFMTLTSAARQMS